MIKDEKIKSVVINSGIKIYPVYFAFNKTVKADKNRNIKEKKYFANNWYIEVNNNGNVTTFEKSIHQGRVLESSKMTQPFNQTYKYYFDKIKKLNK